LIASGGKQKKVKLKMLDGKKLMDDEKVFSPPLRISGQIEK
jgi:hypothetical protein